MNTKVIYGIGNKPDLDYPPLAGTRFRTEPGVINAAQKKLNNAYVYEMEIRFECIGRVENGVFKYEE